MIKKEEIQNKLNQLNEIKNEIDKKILERRHDDFDLGQGKGLGIAINLLNELLKRG